MKGAYYPLRLQSLDPALSAIAVIVVALNATPMVIIALAMLWLSLREQRLMKSR